MEEEVTISYLPIIMSITQLASSPHQNRSRLRCAVEPTDTPNHLCPNATKCSRRTDGSELAYVEKYHCGVCKSDIRVLTPVDSDRQYLTENQLRAGARN